MSRRRRASDYDVYQAWFERTWKDREDAIWARYGPSHPSGSPLGYVSALPTRLRLERPGACVQTFRPADGAGERCSRSTWMHVTHGLTQPIDDGEAPPGPWELAVETAGPCSWATLLLQLLFGAVVEGAEFDLGHRVAAFVSRRDGDLIPYLGAPDQHPGIEPEGDFRWLLLWPHLRPFGRIPCETGSTGILVATGITQDEFALLADVDRCGDHLQLLLCERGIGQVTDLTRASVLADPSGRIAWQRIRALSSADAYGEVVSRFAATHGDERWPFEAPRDQASITLRAVLEGADILLVARDAEDGSWQFLDGSDVDVDDARAVSLAEMLDLDPSLRELAHLPPGWRATRSRHDARWSWLPPD